MASSVFVTLTLAQDGAPKNLPSNGKQETQSKTVQKDGGSPTDPNAGTSGSPGTPIIFWMVILVLFMWFMVFLPQRRERKRHAQMMSGMGKGDKVVTNGGIVGTVVEVREGEVILKVDESNNTRLKFLPDAIRGVVDKKGGEKSEDAASDPS
ncbi:MAG: preprotein translocase subunit YajC [Phycisphaeraceae bacterium]|nr:preprotein translocase subunit YajC [Phycisphaeraceae bacterium]